MIVLDTHVWIWWLAAHRKLSRRAAGAISRSDAIGISAMSLWEVSRLASVGRLRVDRGIGDWVAAALADDRVTVIPVTQAIALSAGSTASVLTDPADQLIFATAVESEARLVTGDGRMHELEPSRIIW